MDKNFNNNSEQVNINVKEKLVRDLIPNIIKKGNQIPNYRIATNDEYENFLHEKLQEEILEFKKDKNIEELADILEVLDAINNYYNFKQEDILNVKKLKASKKGKFKNKIILTI
ncbi:MAG: nucleoside triphosphate pyrophosphohydrolase [Rickettsiales bacterium]